jgi:hypothetical protein
MRSYLSSARGVIQYAIVLLVIIELTAQAFHWWEHRRFTFSKRPHDSLFEPHPYLVGRLQKNAKVESFGREISVTEKHTRWTGAPSQHPALVRVAALGGSTTFGTGVSDEDSWPAILQANLGPAFSVTNFGVPGYSTAEALIQMALVVPEYEPHVVVFYLGWNDIRNYHVNESIPDYFSHGMSQYDSLGMQAPNLAPVHALLKRYSAAWWYLEVLGREIALEDEKSSGSSPAPKDYPDPEVDRIYARNIETLVSLSHHVGAVPLFVPQILNYESFESISGSLPWTQSIDNAAMRRLMASMNAIAENRMSLRKKSAVHLS